MIMWISPACFWGQYKCVLSWYLPLTLAKAKSCKLLTLTMSSYSCSSFVTPSGIGFIIYLFKLLKCVCECFFNISKNQIHKQGQNEKRINSYQITIVIHYHWYSHWTWKETQICNPTAKLFHLIMLASHIDHCVSCSEMLEEETREREARIAVPMQTSIPCKGSSDCLMKVKICEEGLSCILHLLTNSI